MHGVDPGEAGIVRSAKPRRFTVEADDARIRRLDRGQTSDERRLAGAVVADHGQHLAGEDGEVAVVERCHAAVLLRQAGCIERWNARRRLRHACTPLSSWVVPVVSSTAFNSAPPSATIACRLNHVSRPITEANVPYT